MALITPAKQVPGVAIVAVAARNKKRADDFAKKHAIPKAYGLYMELLNDPEIDAIYNPLPNSHHCEWTIAALRVGKHVLCEKPIASNAAEARLMAEAAQASGKVLMEAFHYRYHPLVKRTRAILDSGEIGDVQHVQSSFEIPSIFVPRTDIRYDLSLAGGVTMDAGCYAVNITRYCIGLQNQFESCTKAKATEYTPGVDETMTADLMFSNGATSHLSMPFRAGLMGVFRLSKLEVHGSKGMLICTNWIMPQITHSLTIKPKDGPARSEEAYEDATSTYTYQLRAFERAVRGQLAANETNAEEGIRNMEIIDAIYIAAGLAPRGATETTPVATAKPAEAQ